MATPAEAVGHAAPVGPAGVLHGAGRTPAPDGTVTWRVVTVERASALRALRLMLATGVFDRRSRRNQPSPRTTPTVSVPSPSQSPVTAASERRPNAKVYVGSALRFWPLGDSSR